MQFQTISLRIGLEIQEGHLYSTSPQAPISLSMRLKMAGILFEAMFSPADNLEYLKNTIFLQY